MVTEPNSNPKPRRHDLCYACSAEWTTMCEKCGIRCCEEHIEMQIHSGRVWHVCADCVDPFVKHHVGAWALFVILVVILIGSFALGLWTPL